MGTAKEKEGGAKKKGKGRVFLFLFLLVLLTPFLLPTMILLIAGLLPTYVAFFTDRDANKSGALSVGAMNLAGITPFILDLWMGGQTLPHAVQILKTPNAWLIILGAAFVGHLVAYTVPQAVASVTLSRTEARIRGLKKNLDVLRDSWGPDVATRKPIETIIVE